MVTIKDKTGKISMVNEFIGNNEKLLKKYGYTRVEPVSQVTPPSAPEEKKSINAVAEEDEVTDKDLFS